jgi:hypothetical protein
MGLSKDMVSEEQEQKEKVRSIVKELISSHLCLSFLALMR